MTIQVMWLKKGRWMVKTRLNFHEDPDYMKVTKVEVDWQPFFPLLPHMTKSGKWVWLKKMYIRKVWRYTGFVDEPFIEYGTLFDVLQDDDELDLHS